MADRNSAEIFGNQFKLFASRLGASGSHDAVIYSFAAELWQWSMKCDFSYCQMECDTALIKLGLAREVPDPEYPGETIVIYCDDFPSEQDDLPSKTDG